jgi:hypothetical protein
MGRIVTIQARSTVISRPVIPSARFGLIFSSGRVLNKNYLIGVSLNLDSMFPLKGSQEDHWKGKISWKYHFPAKPNSILLENCPRGFHEGAETGLRRSPGVFGGRMSLNHAAMT